MKKSKIIALLMATACISTAFVGCGDDKACNHVDADKNGKCDSCDTAVITLTEWLPAEKEAEVAMVVNPLPTGAKASDYIGPKAEDLEDEVAFSVGLTKTDKIPADAAVSYFMGDLFKVTYTEDGTTEGKKVDVLQVYDAKKDAAIYTFESKEYTTSAEERAMISNSMGDPLNFENVFFVNEVSGTGSNRTTTVKFYTTAGELFYSITAKVEDPEGEEPFINVETLGDYEYITIDDKVWVVDSETGALVEMEGVSKTGNDVNTFIQRPDFDEVANNIGYVFNAQGTVWAYDLTKWISCVYYNVMPSAWANANTMVLDNGNMLVQYWKGLPDEAVNYDVLDSGIKYDIVQVIINPTTQEMTAVEFGYIFEQAGSAAEKYNDNAKNVVILSPIEDKTVNASAKFEAVIDADLNILYAHKATLVGQDISDFEYKAANVYETTVDYSDTVSVTVLVDGEGKEICKVPTSATSILGLPKVNGKVYSADMATVLFDEKDYGSIDRTLNGKWVIYKKVTPGEGDASATTEYFYFNANMTAPAKLAGDFYTSAWGTAGTFIVEVEVEEATKYEIYNANNEKLGGTYDTAPTITVMGDSLLKITATVGEEAVVEYYRK